MLYPKAPKENATGGAGGGSSSASGDVSMAGIEQLMRKLLIESEEKQKQSFDTSIQKAITEHVQPLQEEMKVERNERLHQYTEIQTQMAELRSQVKASRGTGSMPAGTSRNDEAVIGGFRGKSKAGAILICQKIIAHVAGNPKILVDRVGNAPDVIVIQFSSMGATRQFVTDQKNAKHFDGFWCNISQTPEERDHFKKSVQPLFKIKRAILEVTSMPAG